MEHISDSHEEVPSEKKEESNAEKIVPRAKYISKRFQCQFCVKRFNKKETFITHMKKFHKRESDKLQK